jgi:eukaryotic-like serine/threonine-protein kinase
MESEKPGSIGNGPAEAAGSEIRVDADRTIGIEAEVAAGGVGGTWHYPVRIGHYRILRLVGEGGMGCVYLAEQENPHRIVALKVIKPGFVNDVLLRRFELEAQALGRLQHPGIAQIYEAGTANSGSGSQPYFAMEFIDGLSLIEFVEGRHLSLRARLEMMAKICDAVNHAHQRGIIHRDIKPGNIIVDETGQPKVLDFGVARVTDSDVEATRQTDLGQLIGTLNYMSPEQVLADSAELDIRSDVYALGVITYQLLAGKLPYDINHKALPEVARTIREEDPAPLSSISRTYRGDVQTIVAKALEKDKTRRYASAAELAADIRRYLADQPIFAHPPSASYQLRKFARRHRALVAGATAVFLVLIAGIIMSTWEAVRARRAEASAQAVNEFLQNDLLAQASAANQSGPRTTPDPDIKVRTALDRAAAKITAKFDQQPAVEAAVRDTIGQTYLSLGLYPEARRQLELALALYTRVEGAEDPKTLNVGRRLGVVDLQQGKYVEAGTLLGETFEAQRRVLGAEHPDTLKSMNSLANVYMGEGKYSQAEALHSQNLEINRRVSGPEHGDTLLSMNNLAVDYSFQGKYAQAEALYTSALEIERRVLGSEHPETLRTMTNLAYVYLSEGKYVQAEEIYSRGVEIYRRVLGPEHPDTLRTMTNLAYVYLSEGKYAEAEEIYSLGVEIYRRVLGPEHPSTLLSMNNLATSYSLLGKQAQAEALYFQTLQIRRLVLGAANVDTFYTLSDMATMYQRQGKYQLAETYAAQALAGRRRTLGPEHPDTTASEADLALAYASQGKFTQSESLAREVEATERAKRPDGWLRFWAESLLGESLAGERHYAESEPLLIEGYRGMLERKDRISVPNRSHRDSVHEWIVHLYESSGQPKKAAEWRQQ